MGSPYPLDTEPGAVKLPTFNPQEDGNPYAWILRKSAEVRAGTEQLAREQRLDRAFLARYQAPPPSETEKWRRLTGPQTLEDFGLVVNLGRLAVESPDLVASEVMPFMPTGEAR